MANIDGLKVGLTLTYCKDCDRVEIIRCQNCRHYTASHSGNGYGWCEYYNTGATDKHYCSYGKRKEVANNG